MLIEKSSFRISSNQQGFFALFLWGAVVLFLLRHDVYGLDEGAAKALLLSWSIADQVASSVTTFGMPDLRALIYLPIGFLWTGNVFVAKILTTLLLACTTWLLYAWERRNADNECALIASGLLVISPLLLEQIDSLSPGVYLLTAFVLGAWLDEKFRSDPKSFGGWYFAQLFVCAFSVSLHPIGLAYPLALLWSWRNEPLDQKQQRYFLVGIVFVVLFILFVRMGWGDLTLLQNPVKALGFAILGTPLDDEPSFTIWLIGGIALAAIIAVTLKQRQRIWSDITGRTLLIGACLGIVVGDQVWATIALCIAFYFGLPLLLRSSQILASGGFIKQRGWVLLLVFACSTIFMRADRLHYEFGHNSGLLAQDQLIKSLADEAESKRQAAEAEDVDTKRPRFIVASEWPGRTMIACKCDTFPLPPATHDPQTQLVKLHGLTHLLFDPKQTANIDLARNLSLLGGPVETISLQPGGVMLHIKEEAPPKHDRKAS